MWTHSSWCVMPPIVLVKHPLCSCLGCTGQGASPAAGQDPGVPRLFVLAVVIGPGVLLAASGCFGGPDWPCMALRCVLQNIVLVRWAIGSKQLVSCTQRKQALCCALQTLQYVGMDHCAGSISWLHAPSCSCMHTPSSSDGVRCGIGSKQLLCRTISILEGICAVRCKFAVVGGTLAAPRCQTPSGSVTVSEKHMIAACNIMLRCAHSYWCCPVLLACM